MAAEIDVSNQPTPRPANVPAVPHPGFYEAESATAAPSHNITSPVSELEQPSLIYHELPSSSSPQTPPSELPSSPLAPPLSSGFLGGAAAAAAQEENDPELNRWKADLEALRMEKEQVQRLQSIEARERELSRRIVERELAVKRERGGPT